MRESEKPTATHLVIGRSSQNPRARFRKMPTDTGSTWIGPTRSSRPAITASKIGRSKAGPVEKYSSMVIAGEHS